MYNFLEIPALCGYSEKVSYKFASVATTKLNLSTLPWQMHSNLIQNVWSSITLYSDSAKARAVINLWVSCIMVKILNCSFLPQKIFKEQVVNIQFYSVFRQRFACIWRWYWMENFKIFQLRWHKIYFKLPNHSVAYIKVFISSNVNIQASSSINMQS